MSRHAVQVSCSGWFWWEAVCVCGWSRLAGTSEAAVRWGAEHEARDQGPARNAVLDTHAVHVEL